MIFTKQEIQVFLHKVDGYTDSQIATKMNVPSETIQQHLENIKKKIGLHDSKSPSIRKSVFTSDGNEK